MHPRCCVVIALCCFAAIASSAQDTAGPPAGRVISRAILTAQQIGTFPTGTITPLSEQIATLLSDPTAASAHWGIAVTTLDGSPIYGLDESKLFRPASTAKLFTTAAALALLGPEATVTTTVTAAAPIDKTGRVQSAVVLHGAGDPTLDSRAQYGSRENDAAAKPPLPTIDQFAAAIVAKGVTTIEGEIVGDDTLWPSEPYPEGWGTDDLLFGYGAPVSALSAADNQLTVIARAGNAVDAPLTWSTLPTSSFYTFSNSASTGPAGSKSRVALTRALDSRRVQITGVLPSGQSYTDHLAISDPALFAAQLLKAALEATGVRVTGAARATHAVPAFVDGFSSQSSLPLETLSSSPVHRRPQQDLLTDGNGWEVDLSSPPLALDISATLKESLNLHAEMMLRRLGKAYGAEGSFAQGARVVRHFLLDRGLSASDFVFYDGSGLSTKDLVTPRAEAQLLAYAATQPWFPQWKAALPVGGVDGTLAARFTAAPLKGHVLAKTGTLGESRALAGYLQCASGRELIFTILEDNHEPGGIADRNIMDRIVALIATSN